MTIETPHILLVDSYDSFTLNLAALCRRSIPGCAVHIIKNDELVLDQLLPILDMFSAIIVGPGPGSPLNSEDIGIIQYLWTLKAQSLVPIFGVCLGLQSLGVTFGAQLKRLDVVKHGQVSQIVHTGTDIFSGISKEMEAVRYRSLHVQLDEESDLQKLAWCDDGADNGEVVMALRHRHKPFWAVQYHPESVCTDAGGVQVLENFWRLACEWNSFNGKRPQPRHASISKILKPAWPYIPSRRVAEDNAMNAASVTTSTLHLPELSVIDVCERLNVTDESTPFVMLDSAASPGRFSIIGALTPSTPRVQYHIGDRSVKVTYDGKTHFEDVEDIWLWLATFMRKRKCQGGVPDIPFWGGLIGYFSYEVGVHSLGIPLRRHRDSASRHPDVNMVFVERSVVADTRTGIFYIQSLLPGDEEWISKTKLLLKSVVSSAPVAAEPQLTSISLPDKSRYINNIRRAKDSLFAGDSYELCLTAQTCFSFPSSTTLGSSWAKYKALRRANAAPFSAYLRLHPTTFLSSSPERFLSYSRPPHSLCQLRPIKGTVRKRPGITRAVAEEMLAGSVKEVAENLMIVDLIRHDLHNIVGDDVRVKSFCQVEEYETVWQLVSVIEGRLPPTVDPDVEAELGWKVLRSSLPPGSMTGAPKKRSVEILQELEETERGIYSGVFGYWCVSGGSDWSVTIRSCFKFDDSHDSHEGPQDRSSTDHSSEEWVIGAGGAITALSDPEAEWEEMVVKLQSVLGAFGLDPGASK